MLLINYQQLHHLFSELHIYQGSMQLKEDLQDNSVTHFLSFILIRNSIKYKKICVNCFITLFSSHKTFRNILEG